MATKNYNFILQKKLFPVKKNIENRQEKLQKNTYFSAKKKLKKY